MRIAEARVRNYRCVLDSGWFTVEDDKTILVGPNEAGKTALLQALLRINPPAGVGGYEPAVDLPHEFGSAAHADLAAMPVATARFALEPADVAALPPGFGHVTYVVERRMANNAAHWIEGGPDVGRYTTELHRELARLATHADARRADRGDRPVHLDALDAVTSAWTLDRTAVDGAAAVALDGWLGAMAADIDTRDPVEMARRAEVTALTHAATVRAAALSALAARVPMFVYFDSRFTAGFAVDLEQFADRYDAGFATPTLQDLGNLALFRLLDVTPRALATLDSAERDARLAAVGDQLTREMQRMWRPSGERVEASVIELEVTDGQLALVAVNEGGVRVPLQQRSSGFRWAVSFLVVFLAESSRSLQNTVIMLDEPGTSLHPGKQGEFRATLSRLGRLHQTLFTTHSPYMLDPSDLERVRSVEHVSTDAGTTVHTGGGAVDHAVTAPLLEAVGLRLADELFAEGHSVLFASLSDYWYTSVALDLLGSADGVLASAHLLPVGPVSQLTTLSAFLETQGIHVVALLDTEGAGVGPDLIARRVNGANVVRPAAVVSRTGSAAVEDLFAHTLLDRIAPSLGWTAPDSDRDRPVLSILEAAVGGAFDRRRLARAFIDWAATASADDVDERDRQAWAELIGLLESALRRSNVN